MKKHVLILISVILVMTAALFFKQKWELLRPLTAAERRLDAREIVINQPDFVADLTFFVNEGFGGFGATDHIARKGKRLREESEYWVFLSDIGSSTVRIYPEKKTYDEMVPLRGSAGADLSYPQALALNPDATFKGLEPVAVDGHRCLKIEVIQKDKPEKIYLYAALDLKNLIIASEQIEPKRSTAAKLSNISFEVQDALLQIPSDYRPIERHKWQKVESATITYKGRPSNDYVIFRAPTGELFIRVGDAYYPWTYIYRPHNETVEIAFEGELVDRSGTYIWKTKETEAFSLADYLKPSSVMKDAHLIEIPHGIRFRSDSYEQDASIIEIRW